MCVPLRAETLGPFVGTIMGPKLLSGLSGVRTIESSGFWSGRWESNPLPKAAKFGPRATDTSQQFRTEGSEKRGTKESSEAFRDGWVKVVRENELF